MKWKEIVILKKIKKGDYYYALVEYHPNATKNNYVLYHRVIMENFLKRYLLQDEEVHHIDKRTKNNKISNLQVLSSVEHRALHAKERGREVAVIQCPNCNKIFEKYKNQTHLSKNGKFTTCSYKCKGIISRKIQLGVNISKIIKNNILKIYKRYL